MDTIGLIGQKVSKKTQGKPFLPDELIANILSRLPPKSVAKCRLVCKGWKDLTLPRDFLDLIFRNSIPTILVTNPRVYSRLDLFALDMWWDSSSTKKLIQRFPFYSGKFPNTSRALFSHAGLIVLLENPYPDSKEDVHYSIINPVMPINECVRITLSKQLRRSKIYGVYFHPIRNEYCSLWRIDASDNLWHLPRQIPYKILTLGSNPSLRRISNPVHDNGKKGVTSAVFINNCLYWLLECPRVWSYNGRNDIMEFNIISEEFTILPCPVPWYTECKYHQTRLLNIDGILSFLLVFPGKINIWRLEDQAAQLWTVVEYTLNIEISSEASLVIGVVDGKLALVTKGGNLLVFNLMEGTVRNYQKRKYNNDVLFLSHQMSLVSLSNCKPTITIDLDEKVVAA